jgi:hypothetical protein
MQQADAGALGQPMAEGLMSEAPVAPQVVGNTSFDSAGAHLLVVRAAREMAVGCGAELPLRARALVTFEPSGQTTSVRMLDRFGDTREGRCLAHALRNVIVPPFTGKSAELAIEMRLER